MIKILLPNATKGRNKSAFAPFKRYERLFNALGFEFRTYGRADFVFLGNEDYQDRKLSLDDSINYGVSQVGRQNAPTFLIDGSDSTSITGAYEVLVTSRAKYLFKNQLLSREGYAKPAPFGKWFWEGAGPRYVIPMHEWPNIRLTGWNLGHHDPRYDQFVDVDAPKEYDVCAIYQTTHDECHDWQTRNDEYYTEHRSRPVEMLSTGKYTVATGKRPYPEYIDALQKSKVAISPFGMGEVCFRDFELMRFGVVMVKPDMGPVITKPNPYRPWETYVPVNHDWSNLEEVLDKIFSNWSEYRLLADNFRSVYRQEYLISKFAEHWHSIFSGEPNIGI